MKYPFSPAILDAMPEELAELYRNLELTLLDEICSRLKASGKLNEATVQDIRALRSHGIDLKDIESVIQKSTGISQKKLNALLNDVVNRNQAYYSSIATLAGITVPETIVSNADIEAIRRQTWSAFQNITGSMGFLTTQSGRLTMLPPAKAYYWALDNAVMQIESGGISYNQAIWSSVKQLANSGLQTVNYESGHIDRVDVAVRRATMTGVNQLCDRYTEQSADFLNTRYYEVSAHSGARDKPGKNPWSSHKDWQGKVYYLSVQGERDPLRKYPDLHASTGYGEVDGLTGANCRHHKYPFVEGVMERTYTDQELADIDDGLGCTYEGRNYTAYEATQKQRQIERSVRKAKRLQHAAKSAGLEEEAQTAGIRLQRLNQKYRAFSNAAGLPLQPERMRVYQPERSDFDVH